MKPQNNPNNQLVIPDSEISPDTRTRINQMKEELKGKVLFPEKLEKAKEMFKNIKSLPI